MTEYTLCEKPLIDALESIGWKYIPGRELERTMIRLSAGPENSQAYGRKIPDDRAMMKYWFRSEFMMKSLFE